MEASQARFDFQPIVTAHPRAMTLVMAARKRLTAQDQQAGAGPAVAESCSHHQELGPLALSWIPRLSMEPIAMAF